jgi:hypothetical protein
MQLAAKGSSSAQKARTTVTDARNAQDKATIVNEVMAKMENPLNVQYVSTDNDMWKGGHTHKRSDGQEAQ